MRAIAAERPRYVWRRINVLLQREGIILNHKRLRRIYRAEQLQVRARKETPCEVPWLGGRQFPLARNGGLRSKALQLVQAKAAQPDLEDARQHTLMD